MGFYNNAKKSLFTQKMTYYTGILVFSIQALIFLVAAIVHGVFLFNILFLVMYMVIAGWLAIHHNYFKEQNELLDEYKRKYL